MFGGHTACKGVACRDLAVLMGRIFLLFVAAPELDGRWRCALNLRVYARVSYMAARVGMLLDDALSVCLEGSFPARGLRHPSPPINTALLGLPMFVCLRTNAGSRLRRCVIRTAVQPERNSRFP